MTSRTTGYAGVLPGRIAIYRHAICSICQAEQEVTRQVRQTVIHEVAHHFSIDDRAPARTGLVAPEPSATRPERVNRRYARIAARLPWRPRPCITARSARAVANQVRLLVSACQADGRIILPLYMMAMPVLSMLLASPISPPMAARLLGGQESAPWAGQICSRHGLRAGLRANALDELRGPDAQYMSHPETQSQGGRVGVHVKGRRQAVGI